MSKILTKKNLGNFINYLKNDYQVYVPTIRGDDFVFAEASNGLNEIVTNLTILPPKKLFYPAKELLFKFYKNDLSQTHHSNNPIALVGLSCIDINGISLLDKIMSRPKDRNYWQKRSGALLIGIGKVRKNLWGNFDLFFEEHNDRYLVLAGSSQGKKMLRWRVFQKSAMEIRKHVEFIDPLFIDKEKLAKALLASAHDKIWDDLAKICFGCGICAYVCPLCYCFDIKDEINLETCDSNCRNCSGRRTRYWDACFLPHFFKVAGHDFKEKLRDRIYNWYHHKFVRMPQEFGHVGCISCERCIKYCPAKINYRKVLEEILVKYS